MRTLCAPARTEEAIAAFRSHKLATPTPDVVKLQPDGGGDSTVRGLYLAGTIVKMAALRDRTLYEAVLVDGNAENYKKRANQYDDHVVALHYVGPRSVATKWQSYHPQPVPGVKHKVLDAGCGTGRVGEQLVAIYPYVDSIEIHGGDLSPDMLEVARTKSIYTDLKVVDLKQELPYGEESFDSIVSAGVFLQGHCGPECLPNLIRVLKKGCYLVTTVRLLLYEETKLEWEKQVQECNCELLEDSEAPYHDDARGVVVVIRRKL